MPYSSIISKTLSQKSSSKVGRDKAKKAVKSVHELTQLLKEKEHSDNLLAKEEAFKSKIKNYQQSQQMPSFATNPEMQHTNDSFEVPSPKHIKEIYEPNKELPDEHVSKKLQDYLPSKRTLASDLHRRVVNLPGSGRAMVKPQST